MRLAMSVAGLALKLMYTMQTIRQDNLYRCLCQEDNLNCKHRKQQERRQACKPCLDA